MSRREITYKITPDETIAHDDRGEIVNTYRRWPNPLTKLFRRSNLPAESFAAGIAYGEIYRRAWGSESPAHSDPTRIIVQGGIRNFEPREGDRQSQSDLNHLEATVFGHDTRNLLDAVCGLEMSIRQYALRNRLDREACRERLFEALAKYASHRRRRK